MRPVWAEISLDNLKNNIEIIRKITDGKEIMGIIKADGYGHGAVEIAKVMDKNGMEFYGVACIDEGEELIQNGVKGKILILGCTPIEDWELAISHGIRLTLCSWEEIKYIEENGLKPIVHVKVDTGMGRIGFTIEDAIDAIKYIKEKNIADIEGIFTHLASSAEDLEYTSFQIDGFKKVEKLFPDIKYKHISNSGKTIKIEDNYNIVRPGIIMYGVVPFDYTEKHLFKPVMKLKSKIVFIKRLKEDSFISYNKTYKAKAGTVIATLPLGYADGINRKLSNSGEVEIKGRRCKIVGKVCMDQMMIEIPGDLEVKIGDEATIFGGGISVEEIARKSETIPYEILTCINKRVLRVYIENGKVIEKKSLLGKENFLNELDL